MRFQQHTVGEMIIWSHAGFVNLFISLEVSNLYFYGNFILMGEREYEPKIHEKHIT